MKIAQVLLPGASAYERKSQRIDLALLTPEHDVLTVQEPLEVRGGGVQLAHVYGPPLLPPAKFQGLTVPYVANGALPRRRFALRRPPEPAYILTPLPDTDHELLPEAVDETFFERMADSPVGPLPSSRTYTLGSYARPGVENSIEQIMARIDRFRDDVTWQLFDHPPTPAQLAAIDAWVDPAVAADDFDGFTAEALVVGCAVVATRTPINLHRTENGRTALLVPPNDPNEATHAILAALFKPEVTAVKVEGARQTRSKFRPRQRLRILAAVYGNLIR